MSILVYEFKTYGSRNVKALLGKLACETHLERPACGLDCPGWPVTSRPSPIAMNHY